MKIYIYIYMCEAELQLHFLKLGTSSGSECGPLHAPTSLPPGKRSQNPLNRTLVGLQSRCGSFFKTERSLLTPADIQTLYFAVCSLVPFPK